MDKQNFGKGLKGIALSFLLAAALLAVNMVKRADADVAGTWLFHVFNTITGCVSTFNGPVTVASTLTVTGATTLSGSVTQPFPAVEVLVAGSTITANACGGVKKIQSFASITLSTGVFTSTAAGTFTSPCEMSVINIGTFTITLPFTQFFHSSANVVLLATGTVRAMAIPGIGWVEESTVAPF